jgi:tetratricopeptide (TPR) repeat protein
VAPGEPYEYEPSAEEEEIQSSPVQENLGKSPPRKILLFLGVIALVATVSILVSIALHNEKRTVEDTSDPTSEDSLNYQDLMERGKDAMQAEQWRAAARLFALAQQKEQGSQAAGDMKRIAIEESDYQQAHTAGLEARANGDWREALDRFRKIPQSSHYFDAKQLTEVAGKLCEELLETVKLLMNNKDYADVDETVKKIGDLVEAPKKCHRRSQRLWTQYLANKPAIDAETDTGEKSTSKKSTGRKPERVAKKAKASSKKKDTVTNPYASKTDNARIGLVQAANELSNDEVSTGGGPVERARALADKGDFKGAIAILERAGNSRQVLVLLASLYKRTGNRAGYERVARAFVDRYPNDPAVKEFKKNL